MLEYKIKMTNTQKYTMLVKLIKKSEILNWYDKYKLLLLNYLKKYEIIWMYKIIIQEYPNKNTIYSKNNFTKLDVTEKIILFRSILKSKKLLSI